MIAVPSQLEKSLPQGHGVTSQKTCVFSSTVVGVPYLAWCVCNVEVGTHYVFQYLLNVTKFQHAVTWLKVCVCVVALLLRCSHLLCRLTLHWHWNWNLSTAYNRGVLNFKCSNMHLQPYQCTEASVGMLSSIFPAWEICFYHTQTALNDCFSLMCYRLQREHYITGTMNI